VDCEIVTVCLKRDTMSTLIPLVDSSHPEITTSEQVLKALRPLSKTK